MVWDQTDPLPAISSRGEITPGIEHLVARYGIPTASTRFVFGTHTTISPDEALRIIWTAASKALTRARTLYDPTR